MVHLAIADPLTVTTRYRLQLVRCAIAQPIVVVHLFSPGSLLSTRSSMGE